MAPVLAFEASDEFSFIFAWFEVLHVDIEAFSDDFVGCLCAC